MYTVKEILKALNECSFSHLCSSTVDAKIRDHLPEEMEKDCRYDDGATKFVIIPRDADFVIKVPYSCEENEDWYDYDGDDDEDNCFNQYREFENSGYGDGWDYCEAEVAVYEEAKAEGIEQFFVETSLVGYANYYPIYMQKKVEMFSWGCHNSAEENHRKSTKAIKHCESKGLRCFQSIWIGEFLDCYGAEAFDKLYWFLRDRSIMDLHSGNLGYYNGKPVIVDYGDYRD